MQVVPFLLGVLMTLGPLARAEFTLTIMHTNDQHSHFAPFDKYGSECSAQDLQEDGACFGGVARAHRAVADFRRRYPNSLLMDAGDQFQGTLWFEVHRHNITSHFMNRMGYDVMCAGNHEFDQGEKGFLDFARSLDFPILSANLDSRDVPGAEGVVLNSTILRVSGERVGVIGYTITDTAFISFPERFKFTPIADALRREVALLQNAGVNKIIALGHAGYDIDLILAREVADLDVVVGGHTNTFLYTGPPPSREVPQGDYPTVVKQASGRRVLVVQDYQFVKYLGLLHVTFDNDGEVMSWEGNPVLLNSSYPEDESIKQDLEVWRRPLLVIKNTVVGRTRVLLDFSGCRYEECNLGNLVAEGYVNRFNSNPPAGSWAAVSIAMVNGGSIRAATPPGTVTLEAVLSTHPFGNTVDIISLRGEHIKAILEYCIQTQFGRGGFLQFAGLRVLYHLNTQEPKLSEVADIQVRCADCLVPAYQPLKLDHVYKVALSTFLIGGGDGYNIQQYILNRTVAGEVDSSLLAKFIGLRSPVVQGLEGRLKVVNVTSTTTTPTTPASTTTTATTTAALCTSGQAPVGTALWTVIYVLLIGLTWK